ncbi:MAG: phosphate acyltransferase PlsX [Chlamydiales bacterium]
MDLRLGVDLMGGDQAPDVIFKAILDVARKTKYYLVVLATRPFCSLFAQNAHPRIEFLTTEESIEMGESPLLAIRRKKNSSMSVGMRLLKKGEVDAFISVGNTGALVGTAIHYLGTFPGVERPALLVTMPTAKEKIVVLDVGANMMAKPCQIVSYAKMGAIYQQCYQGLKNPMIGLLNIGVEEEKGRKETKETYRLLQTAFQNCFLGNIEGHEVFRGEIDVLVTDGFTGNIFLKTSEGVSSFLANYLGKQFNVPEIVAHLNQKFNYSKHPGAFLCGLNGLVIKCHGNSDHQALMNGILGAADLIERGVFDQMKKALI